MTADRLVPRLAVALAAIVLLPAALAGCSLLPGAGSGGGDTGDNGAATSAPAPAPEDDIDPNVGLPASFPTAIPLIEGQVLESADIGTGWVVLFGVDDANASFTEGADALVAAGFSEDARTSNGTEGFGQFGDERYTVQLSSNVDYPGYGQAVSYTVVLTG